MGQLPQASGAALMGTPRLAWYSSLCRFQSSRLERSWSFIPGSPACEK